MTNTFHNELLQCYHNCLGCRDYS